MGTAKCFVRSGQENREGRTDAFAAADLDPTAHRRNQHARLKGSNPEATLLCRGKGLEQSVAYKGRRHAATPIAHGNTNVAAPSVDLDRDGLCWRARLDGVLDKVRKRLFQPWRVGKDHLPDIACNHHRVQCALAGSDAFHQRSYGNWAGLFRTAPIVLRKARKQIVHPCRRILERCNHVGAEFWIVGVALGVAGDERELADKVLHIMHDEREPPVELVEAANVRQCFLPLRFG